MNHRKLLSIQEFVKVYPHITESRLRWALRHRESNGLGEYVFTRPAYRPPTLLLDAPRVAAWFARVVPA